MNESLAIAQFLAYVSLTIAGLTVSIVSLRVSHRNNVGWKPLIVANPMNVTDLLGGEANRIAVALTFWNRQRYPVLLENVFVHAPGLTITRTLDLHPPESGEPPPARWSVNDADTVLGIVEKQVAPSARQELMFQFYCTESLVGKQRIIYFSANYYDPLRNKKRHLRLKVKAFSTKGARNAIPTPST